MLSCRDVTERSSDFLDAQLPFRGRLQVRMHLLMCRFCREYMRQMSLVMRALRRLPPQASPTDDLTRELLDTFNAETS